MGGFCVAGVARLQVIQNLCGFAHSLWEGAVPNGFRLDISGKFTLPGRRLPGGQPRPTLPEGGCRKGAISKLTRQVCIANQRKKLVILRLQAAMQKVGSFDVAFVGRKIRLVDFLQMSWLRLNEQLVDLRDFQIADQAKVDAHADA